MQLADLLPAVPCIQATPVLRDLRAAAYLLTYPHICALVQPGTAVTRTTFLQLAAMTYGWMPRILRLDTSYLSTAVTALQQGATATPQTIRSIAVKDLAACLHSVVGASKMLHFVNPAVFPIWDSKIESLRLGRDPSATHMDNDTNYLSFVDEVHAIRLENGFRSFYADLLRVYGARQLAMGIASYPISEVRAVEAAAFELA